LSDRKDERRGRFLVGQIELHIQLNQGVRQSSQARSSHRSCAPIQMVSSGLKACREMQYFLLSIG
jgi:hypothetical protein